VLRRAGHCHEALSGITVLDHQSVADRWRHDAVGGRARVLRSGGRAATARHYPPLWRGQARLSGLNAGKTSLTLDLKSEQAASGFAHYFKLILVEQFRDGQAWLRLTPCAKTPSAIYCSISGYGQTGPRAKEAGHDLNYIGNAGLLALQPGPVESPVVPPALIADIAGGAFPAVINILLALRARDRTGQGCRLDIAMTDVAFTFAWHALAHLWATGAAPGPGQGELAGGSPRYRLYPRRMESHRCAPLEDHFWQRFTAILGR
jgi:crotonobetainyl-CoA:carnitine CoA-transferase CaiB-like acyl-CoA transferase